MCGEVDVTQRDHLRVEMAVREVKRPCRALRISAEQKTNVLIADDSPLISWLLRFAAQVTNKMRIGKDGKNERTEAKMGKANGAIRRESLFRKLGEDVASSFACRKTQGIFVGHHDRTQAVLLPRAELCEAQVGRDRH